MDVCSCIAYKNTPEGAKAGAELSHQYGARESIWFEWSKAALVSALCLLDDLQ